MSAKKSGRKLSNTVVESKASTFASSLARWTSLMGLLILAWFAIFRWPYRVSLSSTPVASDSYAVGFSNSVCVLGVLLVLGVAYLRLLLLGVSVDRVGRLVAQPVPLVARIRQQGSWLVLLFFCVVFVGLSILVGYGAPRLDIYGGESHYFVKHIELALQGVKPYSGMEFTYGPAFIYPPVFFAWIGAKLGFSLDQSYLLCLCIVHVIGLCFLFYFINALNMNASMRMIVFSFMAVMFIVGVFTLGLQYTMIRYAAPYAFLVGLNGVVRSSVRRSRWVIVANSVCAFSFALAALLISPEVGLVTIGAQVVYFGFRSYSDRRHLYPLGVTLLSLPVCVVMFSSDYLLAVFSFGGGGGTFPVVPSFFIVFYLGSMVWLVPRLVRHAWKSKGDENRYLVMALACASVLFLPAALGRCDGGHVLNNGSGTIVLVASLMWSLYSRKSYFYIIGILFVCVWFLTLAGSLHQGGQINYAMATLSGTVKSQVVKEPLVISQLSLDKYELVGVPFDVDPDVEQYLRKNRKYVPGYYIATMPWVVSSRKHVERKIRYLSKASVLLVPDNVMAFQDSDRVMKYLTSESYRRSQEEAQRNTLSSMQLFPVEYRIVNDAYNPYCELMMFIAKNYTQIQSAGGYALMLPKPEYLKTINP